MLPIRTRGNRFRYRRTDLSDLEILAAKLDGVELDRNRDTIHARYKRALDALEKRFGEFCEPPDESETRHFAKKSAYNSVSKHLTPAWVRELHAKFPERRRSPEQKISKDELRAEAERLVARYLDRYPGLDPILCLPPGPAWGYTGDGGCHRRGYPLSRKTGYIVEKRPPGASGASWPVPPFNVAAWLRGNHPWQRGPETRIMAKLPRPAPYYGPVIQIGSRLVPRALCKNKPALLRKPENAAEDALRQGFIVEPQVEDSYNPDEDLDTARFSRASPEAPDSDEVIEHELIITDNIASPLFANQSPTWYRAI